MIKKLFGENARAFTYIVIGLAIVAIMIVGSTRSEQECSAKGGVLVRNALNIGYSCVKPK